MLIEFRCANHRSIRDEQVLTMEASATGDRDDPRPRTIKGSKAKLLPVAVLYGANASGKSNVLSAFEFMRDAVVYSQRSWPPENVVPRDPFAWGGSPLQPSVFEAKFIVDGLVCEYGFSVSESEVLEEWLYVWPNNRKQMWFEREKTGIEFGEHLKGENQVIRAVTRPNSLFLAAAAQLRHKQLDIVHSWFRRINSPTQHNRPHDLWADLSMMMLASQANRTSVSHTSADERRRQFAYRFRQMLQTADVGIIDFQPAKRNGGDIQSSSDALQWLVKHRSASEDAWLPFEKESHGTQTFFLLALPVLQALDRGTVLVIDELESSLHPALAYKIVQLFNDPKTNPKNAQLIFTTHDTNLLGSTVGEPAFRRDQVWLTEKDDRGATVLYPLTDYKPRKDENLERGYLQGRYGAIPFLGNFMTSNK